MSCIENSMYTVIIVSLSAIFTKYLSYLPQGILSDVLKCLGDNKKHMRECTLAALDLWLGAVHLDKMVGDNLFEPCLRLLI